MGEGLIVSTLDSAGLTARTRALIRTSRSKITDTRARIVQSQLRRQVSLDVHTGQHRRHGPPVRGGSGGDSGWRDRPLHVEQIAGRLRDAFVPLRCEVTTDDDCRTVSFVIFDGDNVVHAQQDFFLAALDQEILERLIGICHRLLRAKGFALNRAC